MNAKDRDPYEVYQDGYYTVRRYIKGDVDEEEIEDALLGAMGPKSQRISKNLRAVYDFVRRSLEEKKIPANWIMKAEGEAREILKFQRVITTIGKAVGERMRRPACWSRHHRLPDWNDVRAGLGISIVGNILQEIREPKLVDLLSPEQCASITVDSVEVRDNHYDVRITGSWTHPVHGMILPFLFVARGAMDPFDGEGAEQ